MKSVFGYLVAIAFFVFIVSVILADTHSNNLYRKAISHMQTGEYETAIIFFNEYVRDNPQSPNTPRAMYQLAGLYRRMGNYDQSLRWTEIFFDSFPNDALLEEVKLTAAYALLRKGDINEAIKRYTDFIDNYPDSKLMAEAHFLLGRCLSHPNRTYTSTDEVPSLKQYKLVLSKYPDSSWAPLAKISIGYTYYQLGKYDKAISHLYQSYNTYQEPEYQSRALFWLAATYQAKGDFHKAEVLFNQVISEFPDSPFSSRAISRLSEVSEGKKSKPWKSIRPTTVSRQKVVETVYFPSSLEISWKATPYYLDEEEGPSISNIQFVEVLFYVEEASAQWEIMETRGDNPYEIRWDEGPGPFVIIVDQDTQQPIPKKVSAKATVIIKRPKIDFEGASSTSTFNFSNYLKKLKSSYTITDNN